MSVTPSSTVVGVFRDRSLAEQAVDALYNAGFGQEQIQYSAPGTSDSFFEGLKSIFTGGSDNQGNLADDLTNMGLSDADAQYYTNEYNNGNVILAVRAAERENEAMSILRQHGAYNIEIASGTFSQTPSELQQAGDYTQQSNYAASGQYDNAQGWGAQPQTQTVEEHPFAKPQSGNTTPEYDADNQTTQPITPVNETEAQYPQAAAVAPEYVTSYQVVQTNSTIPAQEYSSQAVSPTIAEDATQQGVAQVAPATPGQEMQTPLPQAGVVSSGQTDELQQLQAQLQTLQQQLQQARAQLQAAKEQEGQLRTARERQQQLQSTRQQIQDLQAELQATMAELQEIQSRMTQYQ